MQESNNVEAASHRFPATFFNPLAPVQITHANLPHWQQDNVSYFVTFRLSDSITQEKLATWTQERTTWLNLHPAPLSDAERSEYQQRFTAVMQYWLDQGRGSCVLRIPQCNRIVENALHYFDGERYHLGVYAIAANHVHVILRPIEEISLSKVLHSWKSFTAKEIAKLPQAADALTSHWETLHSRRNRSPKERLQRSVWQKESYDHIVRNAASLKRIEEYIISHPK